MARIGIVFVALLALPASALALDSSDTISLSPPSGPVYSGYPFAFSGSGSVDGADAGNYGVSVLFTPSSSSILRPSCPTEYTQAATAISMFAGGSDVDYSALGLMNPVDVSSGAFTWSASVNDEVIPTVTNPGSYIACAYLGDEFSGETFAVAGPTPFTVKAPKGSGSVPHGFGGPPGTREPADVTLTVKPRHAPIRAPGDNLIYISGRFDPTTGGAGITLTLKPTSKYDGCAPNDEQDKQIAGADGGVVLTEFEKVTANANGDFKLPFALNFKKRIRGTAVLCAYLTQDVGEDLAVGYERFVAAPPKSSSRRSKRSTRSRRS